MKLVVEINGIPSKDDVLVWDGEAYTPISKKKFLKLSYENEKAIKELKESLENELNDLKEKVNNKLKEYHNILKLVVREE